MHEKTNDDPGDFGHHLIHGPGRHPRSRGDGV